MKNLRVTVDGKVYHVTVEVLDDAPAGVIPERPVAAPAPPAVLAPGATAPVAAAGPGAVPSPLSGKIVSIEVTVGQAVEEGQQVATIEAMKMNTYVFAPRAGKVTAIVATAGTAVEEGLPLLVIG
jgi:biotin carboxyl carrier protein